MAVYVEGCMFNSIGNWKLFVFGSPISLHLTSNIWTFEFLHIFASTSMVSLLNSSHSKGCVVCSIVVLIWISLMTSVEYLYKNLMANIYLPYWSVCLNFLCFFFCRLFPFFLSFENSLYILDTSSLSHISFFNIFFNAISYLFILLIVSFGKQILILMKFS